MTVQQAEMLLAAIIAARATSLMFSKILVDTMAPSISSPCGSLSLRGC